MTSVEDRRLPITTFVINHSAGVAMIAALAIASNYNYNSRASMRQSEVKDESCRSYHSSSLKRWISAPPGIMPLYPI